MTQAHAPAHRHEASPQGGELQRTHATESAGVGVPRFLQRRALRLDAQPGLLLRAKLEIGSVTDPQEAEADRIAEQIMSGDTVGPCSCGGTCAACAGHGSVVQRKPAEGASSGAAPADGFGASRGRPLDASARVFFEPHFGGLSGVRVHDDHEAAATAAAIGARAYTSGADIGFAPGEYAPDTGEGRKVLAHELAHVVQGGAVVRRQPLEEADEEPAVVGPKPTGLLSMDYSGPELCGGRPCFTDEQIYGPSDAEKAAERHRRTVGRFESMPEDRLSGQFLRYLNADASWREDFEQQYDIETLDRLIQQRFPGAAWHQGAELRRLQQARGQERERLRAQRRLRPITPPGTVAEAISMIEEAKWWEQESRNYFDRLRTSMLVSAVEAWLAPITRPDNMERHFRGMPFYDQAKTFPGRAHGEVLALRRKLAAGATIGGWWDVTINVLKASQQHLEVLAGQRRLEGTSIPGLHSAMRRGAIITPFAIAAAAVAPAILATAGPMVIGGVARGAQALSWLPLRVAPRLTTWAGRHPFFATGLVETSLGLAEKGHKGTLTGWDVLWGIATLGLSLWADKLSGGPPSRGPSGRSTGPTTTDLEPLPAPRAGPAAADAPDYVFRPPQINRATGEIVQTGHHLPSGEGYQLRINLSTGEISLTRLSTGEVMRVQVATGQRLAAPAGGPPGGSGGGGGRSLPPAGGTGGGGFFSASDIDEALARGFTREGPLVRLPASPTGQPMRVLEVGAGPRQTNLGLPEDSSLVAVTRTDLNPDFPIDRVLDAARGMTLPADMVGQYQSIIINNPRGYVPDLNQLARAVGPGGTIVIQGNLGRNPDFGTLVHNTATPPGFQREIVFSAARDIPADVRTAPELRGQLGPIIESNIMGGPFSYTTGAGQARPSATVVYTRVSGQR